MRQKDTPPLSPEMEQEDDENEVVYIEDVDEEINDIGDGVEEMEEIEDDAQKRNDAICIFSKHSGPVFCGSLSKDEKLAATGGEDDKAFVWDTVSGDIIFECTGHKDSVTFADFNHDDSYLATGDMSGIIQVWKMSDKSIVWNYDMGDMSWMQWHSAASVLLAGSVQGEIYMWKVPDGDCKILPGSGSGVETATLLPDGKRLAVGYEDGAIRIVDLKSNSVLFTIAQNFGHTKTVIALDCYIDNNLIISAAVDGKTIISSSQTGKVLSVLQDLQQNGNANEAEDPDAMEENKGNWVEAVAFHKDPEHQIAATGTMNGEIFIWDVAKKIIRHTIQQESGISKLIWKEGTPMLFAASLDGILRCFDGRSGVCVNLFISHTADILDLCVSRNGKKVLTSSDDSTARIFEIDTH